MKKVVVAITGGTLLLLGAAMIILPGPAIIVIPAALAILATEFLWARRALRRCRGMVDKMPGRFRRFRWVRRIRRGMSGEKT